ncbi:MAG: DegT/DnrJ/EryC1/StrS family aminotransferase [Bacteroidaceae bacterium]|nr:DegT/DnrJ/EryC1/StrS family aminotransferase [Bacteroidaceae bacterium]
MSEPTKRINLCLAHMSADGVEQRYIRKAFDDEYVVPMGPNVAEFEGLLEKFVNQGHSLGHKVAALSSGTAAVHLALKMAGVGPGDEVCVQSFTFCASSNPITYLGAKPVFIDSEPDTWNINPDLLEVAVRDRFRKTGKYPKAIVPVALYGMPYRIDRIMAIAGKYGIPVIEDSAESLGSKYDGQMLGTFGRYGVLSFNGNKMITTSGGGALICRDSEDKDNVVYFATQARTGYSYYHHKDIGYNYRLSNVCAGIGIGQMTVADAHIAHHRHVQGLYEELLAGVRGVHVHCQPQDGHFDSNYWLSVITLDDDVKVVGQDNVYKELKTKAVGVSSVFCTPDMPVTDCQPNDNVEAMREFMDRENIETRPAWKPMHKHPVYCEGAVEVPLAAESGDADGCGFGPDVRCIEGPKMAAYVNGVSESLFKVGLCLPAGPCVTDDDVKRIVECIKRAII